MGQSIGEVSEYATTVVRLFPDYAGSVIWFPSPVAYEETCLDARLVQELTAWEASYYAGLTAALAWRAARAEALFCAEGVRLARRLADQIGDEFQVEHDATDGGRRRVRGSGPPRNPAAAAAFRRRAAAASAEEDHRRRVVAEGAEHGQPFGWC